MRITEISVTLRDVAPKVVRGLLVPASIRLDQLHEVLQAAFGWQNCHLYQFCAGEPYQMGADRWVMPEFADDPGEFPADKSTLADVMARIGGTSLTYLYDFGDDWEHEIRIGATRDGSAGQIYPQLTMISGNCPPDDIGGPPGFDEFLRAMRNPKHPDHEGLKDWYGGDFHPDRPDEKALRGNVEQLARAWGG